MSSVIWLTANNGPLGRVYMLHADIDQFDCYVLGINGDVTQSRYLPRELFNMTKLSRMLLPNFKIIKVSEMIINLLNLENVNFYNCQIIELPNFIYRKKKMRTVNLANNFICDLPLEMNDNIKLFIMSKNNIPEYPEKIEHLDNVSFRGDINVTGIFIDKEYFGIDITINDIEPFLKYIFN